MARFGGGGIMCMHALVVPHRSGVDADDLRPLGALGAGNAWARVLRRWRWAAPGTTSLASGWTAAFVDLNEWLLRRHVGGDSRTR